MSTGHREEVRPETGQNGTCEGIKSLFERRSVYQKTGQNFFSEFLNFYHFFQNFANLYQNFRDFLKKFRDPKISKRILFGNGKFKFH